MALNDNAVLTAAKGYVYFAPDLTVNPTAAEVEAFDPEDGFDGWEQLGHTSRDELPEFGFEGGDTETRGTWQNEALKTVVTEVAVDYVTMRLLQFDEAALNLYYGMTNASAVDGEFAVESTSGSTRGALLIVIVDGDTSVAFYAPRVEVRREEAIELAVDDFAAMPVRATILKASGQPLLKWISLDTSVNDTTP